MGSNRPGWSDAAGDAALELRDGGVKFADVAALTGIPAGSLTGVVKRAIARREAADPVASATFTVAPVPEPVPAVASVPSPEEYVMAFVHFVETERRRTSLSEHDLAEAHARIAPLLESNRDLYEENETLKKQLEAARAENADMARAVNEKVFSDKRWQDQLGIIGKTLS